VTRKIPGLRALLAQVTAGTTVANTPPMVIFLLWAIVFLVGVAPFLTVLGTEKPDT
jgi:hypothetical protein